MMRNPMSTLRIPGRMEGLPMRFGMLSVRLAALGFVLALNGCATYSSSFTKIEHQLEGQQYDEALKTIEEKSKDKNDRVLYLLNKGMVLRMKRDFVASNESLEAAKQEMERLYAASVSENALSFVVNDATVSYAGDDYEQVLVHLYMALNYLELGQRDEARVEALQVDVKLREIGEKLPASKFTEDALSRYLTGMIYEELGEWSDAMIAYRKAYEAYKKYQDNFSVPMPAMLKFDLVRLAQREGLTDDLEQYQKEFDIAPTKKKPAGDESEGELVFVLNNGLAPIKREEVIGTWAPGPSVVVDTSKRPRRLLPPKPAAQAISESTAPPILVNIALPYYESRPNKITSARISVSGKQANTEMMENVDAIARASLKSRMPAITARAVARAISKGVIQESVDKSGQRGDDAAAAKLIGSLLVRVAAVATERADTRSWLTLPANVQLARLSLPPGTYDVTVDLLGNNDQIVATRVFPQVAIRKERKTYLTQHSMP
jgi:tetratricopeptide (TPR) repeat protein